MIEVEFLKERRGIALFNAWPKSMVMWSVLLN